MGLMKPSISFGTILVVLMLGVSPVLATDNTTAGNDGQVVLESPSASFEGGTDTLEVNETTQGTFLVSGGGSVVDRTLDASYQSYDPSVATVTDSGVIEAQGPGEVTIVATYSDGENTFQDVTRVQVVAHRLPDLDLSWVFLMTVCGILVVALARGVPKLAALVTVGSQFFVAAMFLMGFATQLHFIYGTVAIVFALLLGRTAT